MESRSPPPVNEDHFYDLLDGAFPSRGLPGSESEPRLLPAGHVASFPVPPVPSEGRARRLTSGSRSVIKKTKKEPRRTRDRLRFRHEEHTRGAADPDRGARRAAGAAPGERGRRGDRRLARRRPGPGTGACGGRPGGHRVRGGAVCPVARSGPVVRGRRRTLLSPSSPGVRRARPGPAPPGDGPGGQRDGGARGGGDGASRAGARRGGGRDGQGAALRARSPAPARGRGRRRARLRVPGPGA